MGFLLFLLAIIWILLLIWQPKQERKCNCIFFDTNFLKVKNFIPSFGLQNYKYFTSYKIFRCKNCNKKHLEEFNTFAIQENSSNVIYY
jgi:hypothetical protein